MKQHKKENAEDSQEEGFFFRVYRQFSDESQLSGEWGENTIRTTHTYFKRNVLPMLDKFGPNITPDNLDQIQSELLQKTKENGNSFRDQNTDENFYTRMERINLILKLMSHLSDDAVPLVQFSIPKTNRKRIHREQIKSLPLACFLMLFCLLFPLVMTEPLALACALMVFGGLRTGEAAAVRFGDIRISNKRYATLFITHRINDKGVRTDVLKTDQAYRQVVFPFTFIVLYNMRVFYLKKQGYTAEEINDMLISRLEGSTANNLSAFCKDLLMRAGLTEQQYQAAREQMLDDPDIVDNRKERNVEAYILRRDWATRAANCGMSYVDQDYYLGHKNDAVDTTAYLDSNKQMEISLLLERFVIAAAYSLHPAYLPVETDGTESLCLSATDSAVIKNTGAKPVKYKVTVKSAEPGDPVNLSLPRKPSRHKSSAVEDPVEARQRRPILGVFHTIPFKERMVSNHVDTEKET